MQAVQHQVGYLQGSQPSHSQGERGIMGPAACSTWHCSGERFVPKQGQNCFSGHRGGISSVWIEETPTLPTWALPASPPVAVVPFPALGYSGKELRVTHAQLRMKCSVCQAPGRQHRGWVAGAGQVLPPPRAAARPGHGAAEICPQLQMCLEPCPGCSALLPLWWWTLSWLVLSEWSFISCIF